jgi:hypothetical protein
LAKVWTTLPSGCLAGINLRNRRTVARIVATIRIILSLADEERKSHNPVHMKTKSYISRIAMAASLGISVLPALTPSAQPQTRPWWFYGCPKGVVAQIPGDVPGPGTAGWTQYQSCLQQNLSVSPQQSAQIAPILANEGQKVIAIRNNNSLSDAQKIQEVKTLQNQADPQLKAVLSSAQYDKLKVVRYQAVRWITQKRLGWQ